MRTTIPLLGLALMASSCGSMQPTTQVRDDVYDIPDRRPVMAAATPTQISEAGPDDYYDPADSGNYDLARFEDRDYNDITYNDPQWYNYGRFGFNVGMGMWGPTMGMGMGMGYGMPMGYDPFWGGSAWGNPYWGNSWMSGYGAWGYPYNGWNMGMGMGWGQPMPGWGGMGWGYPYYPGLYPFGPPCCYYPGWGAWGSNTVVAHRPSWTGGGAGGSTPVVSPTPRRTSANSLYPPPARPSQNGQVRPAPAGSRPAARPAQSPQRVKDNGSNRGNGVSRDPSGGSRGGSLNGGSRPAPSSPGGGGSRPSTGGRR
jgi:hypothetical protein